jgi:hypothetical protein
MSFQFLCPQGHLLQGDPAYMGMQTQCPQCGTVFLIPVVGTPVAPVAPVTSAPQQDESYVPMDIFDPIPADTGLREFLEQGQQQPAHQRAQPAPGIDYEAASAPAHQPAAPIVPDLPDEPEEAEPSLLHIPCPKGHVLEVPLEMLGQDVLCPHCRARFQLRHEDSREFKERQEMLEQEREQFWFRWAIAAAVIVGCGLTVLFIVAMLPKG